MQTIRKGVIQRQSIENMSPEYRQAFLRVGLVFNDLKMLWRLSVGFMQESNNEIVTNVQLGYRVNLLRLIVGKIVEFHEAHRDNAEFQAFLEERSDLRTVWNAIVPKCTNRGAYVRIRHTLAFHYPKDRAIGADLPQEYPDETYIYFGVMRGNSFSQYAEDFVLSKLKEILGFGGDESDEKLVSFLIEVGKDLVAVLSIVYGFMRYLVENEIGKIPSEEVEIPQMPDMFAENIMPFLANDGRV